MKGRGNSGRGENRGRPPRSRAGSSSSAGRGDPNADMPIDDVEFVATTPGLDQFQDADDMVATPSPGSHSRVGGTASSSDMPRHPSQRPTILLKAGG